MRTNIICPCLGYSMSNNAFLFSCKRNHKLKSSTSKVSRGLQCRLVEKKLLGGQWLDKCLNSKHQLLDCSSAPQDVTPFIILPLVIKLRLAAFFSYNQAFILILWWRSQTSEQTLDHQMAPNSRRFETGRYPIWWESENPRLVKLYLYCRGLKRINDIISCRATTENLSNKTTVGVCTKQIDPHVQRNIRG